MHIFIFDEELNFIRMSGRGKKVLDIFVEF